MADDPSGPFQVCVDSRVCLLAEFGGGALFESGSERRVLRHVRAGLKEEIPAHRGLLAENQAGSGAFSLEVWGSWSKIFLL